MTIVRIHKEVLMINQVLLVFPYLKCNAVEKEKLKILNITKVNNNYFSINRDTHNTVEFDSFHPTKNKIIPINITDKVTQSIILQLLINVEEY